MVETKRHVRVATNISQVFAKIFIILIISDLNICSGGENRYATPLQMAARFNSPGTARLLIFHGADVTKQSNYGQQALHYAARRGNLAVVEVGCFVGSALFSVLPIMSSGM